MYKPKLRQRHPIHEVDAVVLHEVLVFDPIVLQGDELDIDEVEGVVHRLSSKS